MCGHVNSEGQFTGTVVDGWQPTPKIIKPSKSEEVQIVEAFIKLCIESMTPTLFDTLVDEIIPALEKYRHIKVRSVKELGKEMGVEDAHS